MAIQLWRRHKGCKYGYDEYDRKSQDCSCMIQAEGVLPGYGKFKCLSTGTRSMDEAEKMRFYAQHYDSWDKAQKAAFTTCWPCYKARPLQARRNAQSWLRLGIDRFRWFGVISEMPACSETIVLEGLGCNI